jgi:hypothetical protein
MADTWQTEWFGKVGDHQCRIVFEEKGMNLYELLEFEDQRREGFLWQGNIIYGLSRTRLGNRCVQVPESIIQQINEFLQGLPRGMTVFRNGTKVWRK